MGVLHSNGSITWSTHNLAPNSTFFDQTMGERAPPILFFFSFHYLTSLELSTKPLIWKLLRKMGWLNVNRHLRFLIHSCLQGKDLLVRCHSNNCLPHEQDAFTCSISFKSLIEVLSPRTPLFSLPRKTFGYICYVSISKSDCTKLDPKALKCVFLGYGVDQKWYKCFYPLTCRKFVYQDVIFFESNPFFSSGKTSLQVKSCLLS